MERKVQNFAARGDAVIEKLDFLVRFWELKARHATLGQPLAAREQVELLSLMQLVQGEFVLPLRGPVRAVRGTLPAQLIGEGGMRRVEIRGLSAGAILVASGTAIAAPGSEASPVILRATDAVSGVEYALPCKVIWVHAGSEREPCTIALVVDGIPTRTFFTSPDAQLGGPLSIGHGERLVG